MMRETPAGRDRRDIVVPGDMREGRSGRAGPRRTPRAAAPQGALNSAMTFARAAAQFCLRHPGGALGTVVGAGAALAVCLNAVGFQEGPHPAPILPTVEAKAPDAKAQAAKAQAAKALPARASEPKLAEAKPVPARTVPPREVRTEAPAPAPHDPIADMLRSGETTASVTPKPSARDAARSAPRKPEPTKPDAAKSDAAKPDPAKPDPQIARVQRALAKLGYGPLKDDGLMGPGTKAAIERFERDRKWPVKGEAAGRTLRELTAKASAAQG